MTSAKRSSAVYLTKMEQTTEPKNQLFDGSNIDPQFAVFLKNFILQNASAQPSAIGRATAGTATITDALNTKVLIGSPTFVATGITLDTSNHRFTATVAGKYAVFGAVVYNTSVANKHYSAQIWKTNSQYSVVWQIPGDNGAVNPAITITISDIVSLSVGDYIELYTFHNSGLDEALASGSWLAIHKIN